MSCIRPLVQPKGQLAPRMTRSCISASFTATILPPAWRISLLTPSGPTPFRLSSQCRHHTFNSGRGHQLCQHRVGLCFMVRHGLRSTRDRGERLVLLAFSIEVAHLSPEDPCKLFLPSEFTFLVAPGQDAVLLVDWYSDSILRSSCERSHDAIHARQHDGLDMQVVHVGAKRPPAITAVPAWIHHHNL